MMQFQLATPRKTVLYELLEQHFGAFNFQIAADDHKSYVMDLANASVPGLSALTVGNSHRHCGVGRAGQKSLVLGLVHRGSGEFGRGRRGTHAMTTGDVVTERFAEGDWAAFDADGRRTLLYITDDAINDVVARHFHLASGAPCTFARPVRQDNGTFDAIQRTMNGFMSEAGGFGQGGLQNAIARQQADLLLLTMLDRLPNSLSDLISRSSTPATCRHVRRAIEFMHAHVNEPIGIDDIARNAGCSPRRLQLAFQAHSGTTPMAELRRMRMEEAEARLRSGAYDSVTDVAMSLCFNNIGRFSVEFRRQFGASPSQLLQSSKPMC